MKNEFEINEVDVLSGSLINEEIKSPVYMDALKFELGSAEKVDIEDMVRNFFNSQPRWLSAILINLISKSGSSSTAL